jgi:predicted ArsR family transcriptional regulator
VRHETAATLADAEALGLLADPTRRRLYELIAGCSRPLSRFDAAEATGIERPLVAYHLDKLVAHGLLEATYHRSPERSGPGAGRPPKLYRRAQREFVAGTPARDYRLLAEVLLEATSNGGSETRAAVERAAHAIGRELGAEALERGEPLEEVLRRRGYEPAVEEGGLLRLGNCPFDRLAGDHPELVCGLNLALLQGVLDELGSAAERAVLDPQPGRCCVAIRC